MNQSAAATSHPLPVGTRLASHEIERVLGQGGFGITYQVRTPDGGTAALKEYFPADDAMRVDSTNVKARAERKDRFDMGYRAFLTEARTLKTLPEQRGLVGFNGAFEKYGTVYALMDFIDGQPLHKAAAAVIAQKGHIPVPLLQTLIESLLGALQAIHRVGVVHRDIKPANVMIGPDGQPVLIDFGAARPVRSSADLASMYSRRYAALEQFPPKLTGFRNRNEDGPGIDIFATSVMLYELLAKETPPDAATRFKALKETGRDPIVPLRSALQKNGVTAPYPDTLINAVEAGNALLPQDRPAHAAAFASLFGSFISAPEHTSARIPSRKLRTAREAKLPDELLEEKLRPLEDETGAHRARGLIVMAMLILGLAAAVLAYGLYMA